MESAQALASGLGLVGPILLGAATGHLTLGMDASIGSLAISGAGSGPTARSQVQSLMSALTAGTLLVCLSSPVGEWGWIIAPEHSPCRSEAAG